MTDCHCAVLARLDHADTLCWKCRERFEKIEKDSTFKKFKDVKEFQAYLESSGTEEENTL